MGGLGSGRPESTAKIDAGKKLKLDHLLKQGSIIRGAHVHGILKWTNNYSGADAGSSIGYEANLSNPSDMWIRLHYTRTNHLGEKDDMDYKIRLSATPMHFGGERLWFICPHTGQRAGVLYSPPGSKYFTSRYAFKRLKYRSQSKSPYDRALTRRGRLQNNLGGEKYWIKPKGMHQKTYERKLDEFFKAEQVCDGYLAQFFYRMKGF